MIPSSSNFLERNTIWYENKIEKIVKQKEEEVNKDLEDCTFRPKINNNYRNKNINKSRSITPSRSRNQLNKSSYEPRAKQTSHKKNDPDLSKQEVGKIKNLIRKELRRI